MRPDSNFATGIVMPGEASVRELLLAMPGNGIWMRGHGPFRETLTILLDAASSLVEENRMPEDDHQPPVWLVRLTPAGMAMVSIMLEREDQCTPMSEAEYRGQLRGLSR